jgi:anaerobic magnesium-protoporphyrin IX monomethyl ester cyclase
MNKVLFANAYFYKLDPKQWRFKQPYPPLGTIQAAAVVQQGGFSVSLFDTHFESGPAAIRSALTRERPRYLVIYDDGFNYLTKMCLTAMRDAAFVMARAGKKSGCIVIVSSSDSSDHAGKYLLNGVDFVIRGEGEETLTELLRALELGTDPKNVPGLVFNEQATEIETSKRSAMRDLDALPLPAWNLVDMTSYRKIWMTHHGYFSLNLATTRGCPFKCNWCAKPIYGNRYNARSPEHVIREIEFLLKNYQPGHFWMCDDIFGLKPGWVQAFRDLVVAKKLSFQYKIQSRVDLLLQPDTIGALAQSGAETVWVGAESGSQKILDAMDKGTTVEQIHEATSLLKRNGIHVSFFLQFGYLGETRKDIDATIGMVLDLMPDEIGISVSYPLPGTKFYDTVKGMLREKQNWTDSDDLALMFKNTYPPSFYKVLHRYVHGRYRIQRGLNRIRQLVRKPSEVYFSDLRNIASMAYHLPASLIRHYQLKRLSTADA